MSYLILQKGMALSHSIEDYPDGIVVVVDKPYRWTSADVIRKVKWMAIKHFRKKNLKVGHAGTLDPLATGVLLVCIGKATKLAESFQRERKQYIAGVTFGATTAGGSFTREVGGGAAVFHWRAGSGGAAFQCQIGGWGAGLRDCAQTL